MSTFVAPPMADLPRLDRPQIVARLQRCPRLPSLGSVQSALRELLGADHRYTSQIAEVIRRDPSLTTRLLRLVNSVYYGFSSPIHSIEEAVFFLGIRQIRQLALMTPVVEDLQRLAPSCRFEWRDFWRHCIGTALLTREVHGAFDVPEDESDYVAGLIHDIGKILMAAISPEHFIQIQAAHQETRRPLCEIEREILGADHTEVGALYLQAHKLPEVFVEAIRFHHDPTQAEHQPRLAAAVQVADLLALNAGLGDSGNRDDITEDAWTDCAGWGLLCQNRTAAESALAEAALLRCVRRLPGLLDGIV